MAKQTPGGTDADIKRSRDSETITGRVHRQVLSQRRTVLRAFSVVVAVALLATPVAAQSSGTAFCDTDMATTIKNVFTLIQFGGPLVGGTIALGAVVATPYVRRADAKREIKEVRNQAIIWGLIVAPLATTIVGFLLNEVVAGGASCGF
jgi:uncharacterized membrane protein (DUF485 family)